MKNIKYIKIAFLFLVALNFSSCSDEFLEKDNTNALATNLFWKTIEDLDYGLNATYKAYSSARNISLVEDIARSDISWANGFQRPATSNVYYLQTFKNAEPAIENKWAANYVTIYRANQVIDAVARLEAELTSEEDQESLLQILAQARFIRGYMYFLLHNSYNGGAVPLKKFLPLEEEDFSTPISPADEVRAYYLEDMQYALENLNESWPDEDKGRVTAGAALAIIGQSALYAGDFASAAETFKTLIDDYGYSLTRDIGSNFTTRDEFNEESILEVNYSLDFKQDLDQWDSRDVSNTAYVRQFTGVAGGWFGAGPASWLIMKYKNDTPDSSDERNYVDGDLKKYSLRTSQSIALVDDLYTPYYGRDNAGQASVFNISFSAYWRKHTNWDLGFETEEDLSPGKVRSGVNERLIRLAEIFLQYAECQIELGNIDEALRYINKVRERSGVVLLGGSAASEFPDKDHNQVVYDGITLMDHLRTTEYPLELSAEGDGNRNVDLRRWGIYGAYKVIDYKKKRFEELSQRRYIALSPNVILPREDGDDEGFVRTTTRWASELHEEGFDTSTLDEDHRQFEFIVPVNETFNDLVVAARNYIESEHSYLPIPNSEEISNPQLYK